MSPDSKECLADFGLIVDMTPERNALMLHVYPVLKEYCRQFRLEFQVREREVRREVGRERGREGEWEGGGS